LCDYLGNMKQRDGLTIDVAVLGLSKNGDAHPAIMQRAHRHSEVELNFVETGSLVYLFGGTRVEVSAGQLALFWAAIPHQLVQVDAYCTFHWLTVPFSSFLQWRLPDTLVQQVICGRFTLTNPSQQSISSLFRQWQTDMHAGTDEHHKIVLLEVESCLRRLALSLTRTGEEHIPSSFASQTTSIAPHALNKVEQMARFIADHYTEPVHVNHIAQEVHLHPNYAMSLFRKHFGFSITAYITQYRVSHAQRLLIMTEANVSEIALEAGFGSVSRFYSVFKAACGLLPGEYRSGLQARTLVQGQRDLHF